MSTERNLKPPTEAPPDRLSDDDVKKAYMKPGDDPVLDAAMAKMRSLLKPGEELFSYDPNLRDSAEIVPGEKAYVAPVPVPAAHHKTQEVDRIKIAFAAQQAAKPPAKPIESAEAKAARRFATAPSLGQGPGVLRTNAEARALQDAGAMRTIKMAPAKLGDELPFRAASVDEAELDEVAGEAAYEPPGRVGPSKRLGLLLGAIVVVIGAATAVGLLGSRGQGENEAAPSVQPPDARSMAGATTALVLSAAPAPSDSAPLAISAEPTPDAAPTATVPTASPRPSATSSSRPASTKPAPSASSPSPAASPGKIPLVGPEF